MLVAFPLTFYTSAWSAFVIYTVHHQAFWWLAGLCSSVAGLACAVLAGAVSARLGRLRADALRTAAIRPEAGRFQLVAFLAFALNLLAQHESAGAHHVARVSLPLDAGALAPVQAVPDAALAILLCSVGLAFSVLGALRSWLHVQHEHRRKAAEAEHANHQPRPSRTSRTPLVPT